MIQDLQKTNPTFLSDTLSKEVDVGAIIVKEAYVFNLKERGKENPAPLTLNSYGSSTDWDAMKANIKAKFGIQKVD